MFICQIRETIAWNGINVLSLDILAIENAHTILCIDNPDRGGEWCIK